MFRPIFSASLIALMLTAGIAQADPHIVYTRHVLKVDAHGLDLSRDTDRRAFRARIADAADAVCGGRPDRGNRYDASELKVLLPAYDKCHADAMRSAQMPAKVAELASPPTGP